VWPITWPNASLHLSLLKTCKNLVGVTLVIGKLQHTEFLKPSILYALKLAISLIRSLFSGGGTCPKSHLVPVSFCTLPPHHHASKREVPCPFFFNTYLRLMILEF